MKKKRRYHTRKRLKPYLSQIKNQKFYERFKAKAPKQKKISNPQIKVIALLKDVEVIKEPKQVQIVLKNNKDKKDNLPEIKHNELENLRNQTKLKHKKMKRRLLLRGRDLVKKRKSRRNKIRVGRKLRNKAVRKKAIISARMRYYPLSMHGLLLQNRRLMFLPPSRKTFNLLKIVLRSFVPLLNSAIKKQIYWFSTFRQLLLRLFTLPGFIPKFALVRQINLIIMKELSYKHNNSSYFRKLYKSRWILFQGAFSALSASINSFDRTRKIGISFIGMYVRNVTAALVCNYIVHKLGQYFTIQETLRPVIFDLRKSPRLDGFKIVVAGRLTRKERAAFLIKKKGKLTRSTNDANIDYFSDFKIMRFGVVGVKVWFQVKKRKPYFYRFSFLLFCIAFLTPTLREHAEKQKNSTNFIPKNNNKLLTMKKRGMLTRTSGSYTQFKFTSSLKNSVLARNETKPMSLYVRGCWDSNSPLGKQVTSQTGIMHDTVVDLRLLKYPGLRQLNNAVTSNPNCYKHDDGVIAVTPFAERLLDGSKMKKSEHVAWHEDYFTSEDVQRDYLVKTPSTPENDRNLERALLFLQMPSFIRDGYAVKLIFVAQIAKLPDALFQTNTGYTEGMFLAEMLKKRKFFGVDLPTKSVTVDTKPLLLEAPKKPLLIEAAKKPLLITAPEKPLLITAPEKPLALVTSKKLFELEVPEKLLAMAAPAEPVRINPTEIAASSPMYVTNEKKTVKIFVEYTPEKNTPLRSEIFDKKDSVLAYAARTVIENNQHNNKKELKNIKDTVDDNNQS